MRLSGAAPVGLRLPGVYEEVEEDDGDEGSQGHPDVHEEHDDDAEDGPEERHPLVVVLEAGPPPRGVERRRVKHRKVDQGVGRHEKVGQQAAKKLITVL